MKRTIIETPHAPRLHSNAPVSQAVRTGNLLFLSGITPYTLDLKVIENNFEAQMRQVMSNLGAILKAGGSDFAAVVKCTVILARREDWPAMNRIYQEYWPQKNYPARSAFEAPLPRP